MRIRLVKLLQIPVIKCLFVPFIHFIRLLWVMTWSRTHSIGVSNHVSLAHSEWGVLAFLFVYFLYVKISSWLVISSRSQILIAVCSCLCSYDLIRVVHRRVKVLLFLLFLNGSLQDQNIVGCSSGQLMKRRALIVLKIVVRGARDGRVRDKILFYRTLSGWLKTGRFMIVRRGRLRHLVGTRSGWRAIV